MNQFKETHKNYDHLISTQHTTADLKKEIAKKQNVEAEETKNRLSAIEQDMQDIKRLLVELNSMRTINGN